MNRYDCLLLCKHASDHVPPEKSNWYLRSYGEWNRWDRTIELLEQDEDWAFAFALVRMKEGVG